nr:hypothetical protein [Protofrankia coriariae]
MATTPTYSVCCAATVSASTGSRLLRCGSVSQVGVSVGTSAVKTASNSPRSVVWAIRT